MRDYGCDRYWAWAPAKRVIKPVIRRRYWYKNFKGVSATFYNDFIRSNQKAFFDVSNTFFNAFFRVEPKGLTTGPKFMCDYGQANTTNDVCLDANCR